eukprot:2072275-Prymnesium_polylepis.1
MVRGWVQVGRCKKRAPSGLAQTRRSQPNNVKSAARASAKTRTIFFIDMVCAKGAALSWYLRTHAHGLTRPCCAGFGFRFALLDSVGPRCPHFEV